MMEELRLRKGAFSLLHVPKLLKQSLTSYPLDFSLPAPLTRTLLAMNT